MSGRAEAIVLGLPTNGTVVPRLAMSGSGLRKKRLAGTITKHLAGEFAREVHDPRLAALGIERVEVSGDLSVVKVWVRLMFGGDDPAERAGAMSALGRVAPGLRASLAPVLRMRRVPELRFVYDEGADHRAAIESVLDEIKAEDAQKRADLGLDDDE